jgi:hypothetical protein
MGPTRLPKVKRAILEPAQLVTNTDKVNVRISVFNNVSGFCCATFRDHVIKFKLSAKSHLTP